MCFLCDVIFRLLILLGFLGSRPAFNGFRIFDPDWEGQRRHLNAVVIYLRFYSRTVFDPSCYDGSELNLFTALW
jgi:hypothetical protein